MHQDDVPRPARSDGLYGRDPVLRGWTGARPQGHSLRLLSHLPPPAQGQPCTKPSYPAMGKSFLYSYIMLQYFIQLYFGPQRWPLVTVLTFVLCRSLLIAAERFLAAVTPNNPLSRTYVLCSVLRIQDVYPRSRFRIFSIPDQHQGIQVF